VVFDSRPARVESSPRKSARPRAAWGLLLLALAVSPAAAQVAPPFEVIPQGPQDHESHRLAWAVAATGAALIAGSFPLADEAYRRYARYLAETDVARIDERFQATARMDRLASGSMLAGEVFVASAVWLRFLHPPRKPRHLTFMAEPDLDPGCGPRGLRCAVALRF